MRPERGTEARDRRGGRGNGRMAPASLLAAGACLAFMVFVVFPAGAALTMMPVIESVQVGGEVTFSGINTENSTTFLFLTGPGLDDDGVMLTNTSRLARDGNFDLVRVRDYAWQFTWNTSLPGIDIGEGVYVVYATTDPLRRSSLPGRTSEQQVVTFRGRLFPATTPTTRAPTPVPTWAPPPAGTEVRVSSAPSDDYPGRFDGEYLVYEAKRGEGDSDIYLYNISSGNTTAVATGPAIQNSPAVSGLRVVYSATEVVKFERSDADLFIYDIATGSTTRLTRPGDQLYPRISGNILAWQDETPGRSSVNIVLHDLATNVTVQVPAKARAYFPDLSGKRVIWLDDPLVPAVFLYDMEEESVRRILNKTGIKGTPSLDGARIAWADTREDFQEIYVLDLTTGSETQVTTDASNHFTPALSGDRVAWVDFRNGNRDIFLYDLLAKKELAVTTSEGEQIAPQVSGCTVAWADERGDGSYDVYYKRIPGCTPAPAAGPFSLEPEVTIPLTEVTTVVPTVETPVTTRTATSGTTPATPSPPVPTTEAPGFGVLPALAGCAALAVLRLRSRAR